MHVMHITYHTSYTALCTLFPVHIAALYKAIAILVKSCVAHNGREPGCGAPSSRRSAEGSWSHFGGARLVLGRQPERHWIFSESKTTRNIGMMMSTEYT